MGWSDLPSDLVITIAAHLWEAGDYLRFHAVCRSWKSAVRGFRPSFFPWLAVIPSNGDPNEGEISFINHVASDRVYNRPMPYNSIVEYWCINKDGLMTIVGEDGEAVVFNPVTGAQLHRLPSLNTCFHSTRIGPYNNGHLILAPATPGDVKWSAINLTFLRDFNGIKDMVFHEADNKFYAVNWKAKLLSFRLIRCGGKTVVGEVSTLSKAREGLSWLGAKLVSYGSNLLLVIGTPSWKEDFEILKYCPDADTWIGVNDIDFGNNSLFIDFYGAKLLPLPQGEEGKLRRNCIYFIDYKYILRPPDQLAKKRPREEEERIYFYTAHVRIYDVSKGVVELCFSTSEFQFFPVPMWFTPSLSINN